MVYMRDRHQRVGLGSAGVGSLRLQDMAPGACRPAAQTRLSARAGISTRPTPPAMLGWRMPRTALHARLEIVEEQIALGETNIEVQLGIIKELRAAGYATGDAEAHLAVLAATLVAHLAERDKLRAEVAVLGGS
jgi:hypothetical protein